MDIPSVGIMTVFPILKLAFESDYLWAWGMSAENNRSHYYLLAIDTSSGTVAQQWDMESAEGLVMKRVLLTPRILGSHRARFGSMTISSIHRLSRSHQISICPL
jgi:hypothetical protein